MSRVALAFSCLFSLLFRGRLPAAAARYLPSGAALPAPAEAMPFLPPVAPAPVPASTTSPSAPSASPADGRVEGALLLLGLLQREGRLVDFLRESLDQHADAAIGAAVRDIHRGCKKVLDEHVRLEPVMPGQEEGPVVVPRGFDPAEVRLIGKASGEPPFRGILVHHGWRALGLTLPTVSESFDRRVLAPAEVRLP
jgi:hypothetical protein